MSGASNVSPRHGGKEKRAEDRCIYTKSYKALEEDDIAQVREIFKSFDLSNLGKISIEYLPRILRLLNYNIGKTELHDLILVVDKKSLGHFTMKELVILLSEYKFKTDKKKELFQSLAEIDNNGDGYISTAELVKYMQSMAEPLEDNEAEYLIKIC